MSERCPICDSYSCSCRCSAYELRQYQDDHRFDHSSNVLARWRQDDRDKQVEQQLRDLRRREEERQEEARKQTAARHARHREEARQEQIQHEQQEQEQSEQEPTEEAQP